MAVRTTEKIMTQYETFSTTRENVDIIQRYCDGQNISKSEFYEKAVLFLLYELTGVCLYSMKRNPNHITKNKSKLK